MANNVFANGLEIACKAADGKSIAAFPDPCMVTPCPTTPPVIIPLPNTAYAKDTSKGSKTVFISGKQVMLKDKSYFKKSKGNEIAKCKKGLITSVKKGKAYFASWSFNVKIEGYNVDRHTDLITHNHGSFPQNVGPWYYADSKVVGNECKQDRKEAEKASKKKPKDKERTWKKRNIWVSRY